jgi:hypothetical protein
MSVKIADKLTKIAIQQLEAGLKLKSSRMDTIKEIEDLYNNKIVQLDDDRMNIPFPIMSSHVDTLFSKIDNPPNITYKITNAPQLADKVAAIWKQERSSMRAGWERKDRAEKKLALMSGRGISKIYSTSLNNEYESHYEIVDYHNFVCEGTRGHLDDNVYMGEMDIYKTIYSLQNNPAYDKGQITKLLASAFSSEYKEVSRVELENRFNRMKALNLTPENNAYVGQKVVALTEWIMDFEGEKYYLLFDPQTGIWVRAELLKDVFSCDKTPFVSWASNYEEYNFWTKGDGDDIMPMAEAMRFIINNALENERRRTRPMRIVSGNAFADVNELMDYIPDNVIVTNPGNSPDVVTVETPQVTASINLAQFLNNFMQEKSGVTGTGVQDADAKVGVYYGQLQQEADRIGIINKNYSESYAEKGYRFFWGLKDNLTENQPIEMLGKNGVQMEELMKSELVSVDDVDDIITSGGAMEEQLNEVKARKQSDAFSQLTGNPIYSQKLNPEEVIKTTLELAEFTEEKIDALLDQSTMLNRDLREEADQSIREILLGRTPKLNRGATTEFMRRIYDYVVDNLDYIKVDKKGNETGIDKKKKEQSDLLLAHMEAHQPIVIQNMATDVRAIQAKQLEQEASASNEQMGLPVPSQQEQQASLARPFEGAGGTPTGTAEQSQVVSQSMR